MMQGAASGEEGAYTGYATDERRSGNTAASKKDKRGYSP